MPAGSLLIGKRLERPKELRRNRHALDRSNTPLLASVAILTLSLAGLQVWRRRA